MCTKKRELDAKYTAFSANNILEYRGKSLKLDTPKVMGILNVTPDSFYDGGKYTSEKKLLTRVEQMLVEGADILDIGGYSSRPGAKDVDISEESKRVINATELILKNFPDALISVDTYRSLIAERVLEIGVFMINDISGGELDPNMLSILGKYNCPLVMMHMKGTPQTMVNETDYEHLIEDLIKYFKNKVAAAKEYGMTNIIIDPGFGFAKTLDQNYEILRNLDKFTSLEQPLLVGVSRKSMIYNFLNTTPENALNGTSVLNTMTLTKGASILRVHDVKEAKETIQLYQRAN